MTDINPSSEPDITLNLPDVVKQNWKSQEILDFWDGPLGRFPDAFEEALIAAVQDSEHPRDVYVTTVPSQKALDLMSELPEKVGVAHTTSGNNATVAISTSAEVTAEEILSNDLDPIVGMEARGVPSCCANAYHQERSLGHEDPIPAIARNTPSTVEEGGELVVKEPYPILNTMWAFLGWRFIEFYPCSYECDHARNVAIENGKKLRELDYDETADHMFQFLASPSYWSGYHGLAHVKNGWSIGEYTTDDNWTETIVRFNGYHDDLAEVPDNL